MESISRQSTFVVSAANKESVERESVSKESTTESVESNDAVSSCSVLSGGRLNTGSIKDSPVLSPLNSENCSTGLVKEFSVFCLHGFFSAIHDQAGYLQPIIFFHLHFLPGASYR